MFQKLLQSLLLERGRESAFVIGSHARKCMIYSKKIFMILIHGKAIISVANQLQIIQRQWHLLQQFTKFLARRDRAASIAARRHSRRIVVTASVNHVAFNRSVPLGSVVTIEAKVSRAFSSSMEVYLDVWIEDRESGESIKANEAIYTFVAVDDTGRPVKIPALIPETKLEKERFDGALRRKQLSLVLAGKMKPEDATELKAIFFKN